MASPATPTLDRGASIWCIYRSRWRRFGGETGARELAGERAGRRSKEAGRRSEGGGKEGRERGNDGAARASADG